MNLKASISRRLRIVAEQVRAAKYKKFLGVLHIGSWKAVPSRYKHGPQFNVGGFRKQRLRTKPSEAPTCTAATRTVAATLPGRPRKKAPKPRERVLHNASALNAQPRRSDSLESFNNGTCWHIGTEPRSNTPTCPRCQPSYFNPNNKPLHIASKPQDP